MYNTPNLSPPYNIQQKCFKYVSCEFYQLNRRRYSSSRAAWYSGRASSQIHVPPFEDVWFIPECSRVTVSTTDASECCQATTITGFAYNSCFRWRGGTDISERPCLTTFVYGYTACMPFPPGSRLLLAVFDLIPDLDPLDLKAD